MTREEVIEKCLEEFDEETKNYDIASSVRPFLQNFLTLSLTKAFEAGKKVERELIIKKVGWLVPIAGNLNDYVEKVKSGNFDSMYDYGFNRAKEVILSLLTKSNENE